jgi:diguanylate cyclase (GGDEF)-like protein
MFQKYFSLVDPSLGRGKTYVEQALTFMCRFGVPIALVVLVVLMAIGGQDTSSQPVIAVPLHGWEQTTPGTSLEQARTAALQSTPQTTLPAQFSKNPLWWVIHTPVSAGQFLVFPSRHALSVSCWSATGELLGTATRAASVGALHVSGTGFSLRINAAQSSILCQGQFEGPARVSAAIMSETALENFEVHHSKQGALIEAGMGVLALFMLISAWINKEPAHLVFGVWLGLGMRMAALSAGTDFELMGWRLPLNALIPARQWTIAFYFATTVVMFSKLFKTELEQAGVKTPTRIIQGLAMLVMGAAALLAYGHFLIVVWVCTTINVALILYSLTRVLMQGFDRAAAWYGASIVVTLAAGMSEVVAAALSLAKPPMMLTSVSAAVISALMASLAIAERIRSEREEKDEAKSSARRAYEGSPIGLFTLSCTGTVVKANPAMQRMMGFDPVGYTLMTLLEQQAWHALSGAFDNAQSSEVEVQVAGLEPNTDKWFLVRGSLDAKTHQIEGSIQDATEAHASKQALEFLASHDPLTTCLNLRGATAELEQMKQTAVGPVSMVYLDLDRFKLVNDLYGHPAGDHVLREVCMRMRACVRARDAIARVGGDEFLMVFPSTAIEEAHAIVEKLMVSLCESLFHFDGKSFSLSASAGLVESAAQGFHAEDMISAADAACRMAKKQGKRLVEANSASGFYKKNKEELEIARCLEDGRMPQGLTLFMQPIMSLKNPFASLNFEVLLRLRKPDGSILGAVGLIETAEFLGKIALIDRWVLRTTLEWIEQHMLHLSRTKFISVNLSGASMNDEVFLDDAFAILSKHREAASKLCLEITETVALTDIKNTIKFVERARQLGLRIAIDDFGSGFAGFTYLRDVPSDSLKLDGSLVQSIATNPATHAIVHACAGLANSLGMTCVGEFAENLPIIKALVDAGVSYAQGYGISKPVEPERILAAQSSADFIQDADTMAFVRELSLLDFTALPDTDDERLLH